MENNNNFELKEAFDLFDANGDGQVCLYTDSPFLPAASINFG